MSSCFSSTNSQFLNLLTQFMRTVAADIEFYASKKLNINFPVINKSILINLCHHVEALFASEPSMIDITSPCTVVGDLHGHVLDLFRILKYRGLADTTRYVFLGDIIDRGEFSIETITVVFLLKACYPNNVFIIRGNHEFDFLACQCGFSQQVFDVYNDVEIYEAFLSSFSQIPFAVRIDEKILCVHGGVGPSVFSLKNILQIQRPVSTFGDEIIDSLLWSDPSEKVDQFKPSSRGSGFFYSESALEEFLDLNDLQILVRAHECVMDGCETMFHGRLLTIFSASNYCNNVKNDSAVLSITAPMKYEIIRFHPLEYLKRTIPMSKLLALNTNNANNNFSNKNNFHVSPYISPRDPHKLAGTKLNGAHSFCQKNFPTLKANTSLSKLPPIDMKKNTASFSGKSKIRPKSSL